MKPSPRGTPPTPPGGGLLGRILTMLAGAVLLVAAFMFSLVALGVLVIVGVLVYAYLHWKTRHLRRHLEEQMQQATKEPVSPAVAPQAPAAATLITQPIRSGQRIYASGDLIILSQVSAGAEIMAEGNIHVYNTLRGRALAGVHGNTTARIFCFDLQAELISIAGDYKTSEDLNKQTYKNPVQIYLQNHALIIKEIA